VCNAAWRSARLGRISRAQMEEIAANLSRFFDGLVSSTGLAPRAVVIAGQLDHPVYDCLYLALAEAEQTKLVTADLQLPQDCPGKVLRRRREGNRLPNFVLAGLDPAIHGSERSG